MLYINDMGAVLLTKELCFHSHTCHILVHFHFVCELVDDDTLTIQYIPTLDMLTNDLTKPFTHPRHFKPINGLYLCLD